MPELQCKGVFESPNALFQLSYEGTSRCRDFTSTRQSMLVVGMHNLCEQVVILQQSRAPAYGSTH
jgi:hypothetical protein